MISAGRDDGTYHRHRTFPVSAHGTSHARLHIQRPAVNGQRRFPDRFGQGRVRVTDPGDIFG